MGNSNHSIITTQNVRNSHLQVYTVEPLYSGHHWDCSKCPDKRGVLISEVGLHGNVVGLKNMS